MTNLKRRKDKIKGTATRPRLVVSRSNRQIFAQLINDQKGETLAAASEKELGADKDKKQTRIVRAGLVGEILAKKAIKAGFKKVVFDRNVYHYHGRVKALAEGARQGGLEF